MQKAYQVKNTEVKITDGFWSRKIKLIKDEVIPYQHKALRNEIENAEPSYCLQNFERARAAKKARQKGESVPVYPTDEWRYTDKNSDSNSFKGWVFQDSDLYKWIEAASYTLENFNDNELEAEIDKAIELICEAQEDDGYINTFYGINNINERFTNLRDKHELYCFGHLADAAAAYYEATGKRRLLDCTIKFADLICDIFGENGKKGYGGHEIAEAAMVRLYGITGEKKYLKQASLFIERRGTRPYYFDIERNEKSVENEIKYTYNQAHIPVREQTEAVGHAVRAVYLYSGMADVARETSDEELLKACKTLFKNITQRKMYITGGIGSTVFGEAFTGNYDLPNDSAYAETCASIGLFFFAYRMLLCDFKAEYADIMERCVYNSILSGISESGREFFYVNPLEVIPKNCKNDERLKHIKATRQKWFGCACCPPNLARLIAGLGGYCFTQTEDTVFINLYQACTAQTENAVITIDGDYIKDGKITVKYEADKDMRLALRIPSWSNNFSFSRKNPFIKDGYAYFDISGKGEISAEFNPEIRIIQSNPAVRENIGKCAITRGPIVYCLEEADNGEGLWLLRLSGHPKFYFDGEAVFSNGYRQEGTKNALYYEYTEPKEKLQRLKFIPYYKWANRGENEMSVYIRI